MARVFLKEILVDVNETIKLCCTVFLKTKQKKSNKKKTFATFEKLAQRKRKEIPRNKQNKKNDINRCDERV